MAERELFDALAFEKHCPEIVEIGRDLAEVLTPSDAERLLIEAQTAKQLKHYIQQEHGYGMYEAAASKFELHARFTEYVFHLCTVRNYRLDQELQILTES